MLLCVGQPLFAEDTWLHLSLGRVYAAQGPWLDADPLLHTAQGPPAPASWLFDVGLYGFGRLAGFQGLRIAHTLLVAGILALAWSSLRRVSASPIYASLGTSLFVVLSAYRLFQLRPHLITILATLVLLHRLVLRSPPSWRDVFGVALLFALWANLHGGFVVGLALLAAGAGGAALLAIRDAGQRCRARRLVAALGLGGLATLANPGGAGPHLLYFRAGAHTPSLAIVADEWASLHLFAPPPASPPPSPATWAVAWALVLLVPLALLLDLRRRRDPDPVLVATAAVSFVGLLAAVRLLWLGLVPLLLLGRSARGGRSTRLAPAFATAAVLLVPGFVVAGAWPAISKGVNRVLYSLPYAVSKQDTHAVWFLRDTGLEGRLFNDYATGDFLGYWLAPRLRVFVNGSLNVPPDVMRDLDAIQQRAGPTEIAEILDRYRVDVFFGTGLPVVPRTYRDRPATTSLLEGVPGWLTVFRSVRSAIYLREDARNRENLERVIAYYGREGVPFDSERGFDPARAIAMAPRWAFEHGIAPFDLRPLEGATGSLDPVVQRAALGRLAELKAVLGSYRSAVATDRRLLARGPASIQTRRRLVWCLLRQGRVGESLAAADALAALAPPGDALSGALVRVARRAAERPAGEAAEIARLPLLTPAARARLVSRFTAAEVRPARSETGFGR